MRKIFVCLLLIGLVGCGDNEHFADYDGKKDSETSLYAMSGREYKVGFQGLYRSAYRRLEDVRPQTLIADIKRTTRFLFGPLTHRQLGGVQKGERIEPRLAEAFIQQNQVMVPYDYHGTWMIRSEETLSGQMLPVPVPYSPEFLRTAKWKNCTDSGDAEHSTWSFFWYFWDPQRRGCDHQIDVHYQEVLVRVGNETPQTNLSFPEYKNLIHIERGVPTLSMTFAFGYVEDSSNPHPFKDSDYGMREFQKFYQQTKVQLQEMGFKESPVYQGDITEGATKIGAQFTGVKDGIQVRVSIIAAAGVDQMDLFAHSYAQNHESFFAWFGHSRVGSGFDADLFKVKLARWPKKYSVSPDYQIVYWAGCNSYSYYTSPFFDLKSQLDPLGDPQGTRKLDLISNTLPSLFAFNAENARISLQVLLRWQTPTSYQKWINQIEQYATSRGFEVMVNVLGDEDNI